MKGVNEQAAEIASLKASGGQITDSERQMHAADRRMNDALRSEIAALKDKISVILTEKCGCNGGQCAHYPLDPWVARAVHAESQVAALKAEVERLSVRECGPCLGVGRIASSWEGREVNIDCPNCGGTGGAR